MSNKDQRVSVPAAPLYLRSEEAMCTSEICDKKIVQRQTAFTVGYETRSSEDHEMSASSTSIGAGQRGYLEWLTQEKERNAKVRKINYVVARDNNRRVKRLINFN